MPLTRAVQTRPEPDNPAKPPDDNPIPARTEGPVGRRQVSVLKNRHRRVEWWVRISKTRATRTDRSYKKIRPNPTKTSQIRLYLVGFSQIRPNPTISSKKKNAYFRKNPVFDENFPISGEIFQFPAKIPDSDDAFFFRFRCLF